MGTCFVMQPFDQGPFDQRFEDILAPAIKAAGLEPYRVDRDPKVSIPIEDIEKGIRESDMCLADITQDNPNVWFELGYAIACRKEVVLICSKDRTTKFPFDIQHRTILAYPTSAPRDFKKLEADITAKLKAYLEKAETLSNAVEISKVTPFEGLDQHEVVCLAALAENIDHPGDHASVFQIKRDMEKSGFTKVASTLALSSLLKKGLVYQDTFHGQEVDEVYTGYVLTDEGWRWVLDNKDQFVLRKPRKDENPF